MPTIIETVVCTPPLRSIFPSPRGQGKGKGKGVAKWRNAGSRPAASMEGRNASCAVFTAA